MTVSVDVPGSNRLELAHLVLDYNGTLACDGALLDGVAPALETLAANLEIHVVTADTFGGAKAGLEGLPCLLRVLPPGNQTAAKADFVGSLGAEAVVAIGNGRNDAAMLAAAGLGIAVVQEEGAATAALSSADVICPTITSALGLLTNPDRLRATLRQ